MIRLADSTRCLVSVETAAHGYAQARTMSAAASRLSKLLRLANASASSFSVATSSSGVEPQYGIRQCRLTVTASRWRSPASRMNDDERAGPSGG